MAEAPQQQFILLPERGVHAPHSDVAAINFLINIGSARSTLPKLSTFVPGRTDQKLDVIDSVHEDGPKLVSITSQAATALRAQQLGVRLEPIRKYFPAVAPAFNISPVPGASGRRSITLQVIDKASKSPVCDSKVTVFTNFTAKEGAEEITDASGKVTLSLGRPPIQVERLYVKPPLANYWGLYKTDLLINDGDDIEIERINLGQEDALRHFSKASTQRDGAGVKVAVIDTGVDMNHNDIHVTHGQNTVTGEPRNDWNDNGLGHGTHVAGVIASRGSPPTGISGLAPACDLFVYRVFGSQSLSCTNYSLIKAMTYALDNGCDIINLSIGGLLPDDVLREALEEARGRGSLVVIAAGNDGRGPVSVPASYDRGMQVSAMGRCGSFPKDSYDECHIDNNPGGNDSEDFIASFSNIGRQVSVTAPGVGIISTTPGGYGPMSGTSMACPVVAGVAARLLSYNSQLLNADRDANRSRSIAGLVYSTARSLGFPFDYEGSGMPL